jgi:hypothetical protein
LPGSKNGICPAGHVLITVPLDLGDSVMIFMS